jgi:glycosyltransferase involved in cell wall biosynthesis
MQSDNSNKIKPIISVIVPCRNEKTHIEACVRSILTQDLPSEDFEVLVVDGMSDDGTRTILVRMAEQDVRVRIIDNPYGITPYGRNAGVQAACGRYIAILDAHTEYAPDYLRACFELLQEHPEVCCSGGPIISQGKGLLGRAVAAVMSHPVGVGNAKHRFPNYEGYAEGACFPMFRKEIFKKVGLFDENLIRNQDDEFNYRLARAGEKVFISPRARCTYFVRETPSQLFRQYFQYGFWRVAVLRKHRSLPSVRQIIPASFLLLMGIFFIAGLFLPGWWRLAVAVLPVAYAAVLLGAGVGIAVTRDWAAGLMFPVAAILIHTAYAAGFTWGIVKGRSYIVDKATYSSRASHAPRA